MGKIYSKLAIDEAESYERGLPKHSRPDPRLREKIILFSHFFMMP